MSSPVTAVGQVRRFRDQDISQVAELHQRVFATGKGSSDQMLDSYKTYFNDTFLNDTWRDADTHSLVYEDSDGQVVGFFGAVVRKMSFNGKPVRAKIGSQAVVDPASRGWAGLSLYRAFLEGPHDQFIGDEGSATSCQIWEGFGGVTAALYSMNWIYPIRAGRFSRFIMARKKLVPAMLFRLGAPVEWALDTLGRSILKPNKTGSRQPGMSLHEEELTCDTLLMCLTEHTDRRSLRPVYDRHSLDSILRRAEALGSLQKVLVRDDQGKIAGWFLYYADSGPFSEVLQVYAKPDFKHAVLDSLFGHAHRSGVTALRGRLEPSLLGPLSDKHCIFQGGPAWALVYARRPELLHALHRGDAFFSRLEGEWCLHFQ